MPHITMDARDLFGHLAEKQTEFEKLKMLIGEAKANEVLDKVSRNAWQSAYSLGSTFQTDGDEILLSFHKASAHARVCKDGKNAWSRVLKQALEVDPNADTLFTRQLFLVGSGYGSYKPHLLRAALSQGRSGELTAKAVFEKSPTSNKQKKQKKKTKKDGHANDDDGGLGPEVAAQLKPDPVDWLGAEKDLSRVAYYERALRVGVLRGARTWATLQTLLVSVLLGIDTGQSEWLSILAAMFSASEHDTSDEAVLQRAAEALRQLDGDAARARSWQRLVPRLRGAMVRPNQFGGRGR